MSNSVYSWKEILANKNLFKDCLQEYVTWTLTETGIPHKIDCHADGDNSAKPKWITNEQAVVVDMAVSQLRVYEKFAYRVFWKKFFCGYSIISMSKQPRIVNEFITMYGWDQSREELKYQLQIAVDFLYKWIEKNVSKD